MVYFVKLIKRGIHVINFKYERNKKRDLRYARFIIIGKVILTLFN